MVSSDLRMIENGVWIELVFEASVLGQGGGERVGVVLLVSG